MTQSYTLLPLELSRLLQNSWHTTVALKDNSYTIQYLSSKRSNALRYTKEKSAIVTLLISFPVTGLAKVVNDFDLIWFWIMITKLTMFSTQQTMMLI